VDDSLWPALGVLFKSHPWHGPAFGEHAPEIVTCFIEIVPTDAVKYELDKATGLLKVDRPQKFSNVCPSLYGLVPQTLCGERVAALTAERAQRAGLIGDNDPLDICVLTEKPITHGNILVQAVPIGGLRLIDRNEADDKIVAVMAGDAVYGGLTDLRQIPPRLLDRLRHYFLTYKQGPDDPHAACELFDVYGREEAHEVIRRSHEDYLARFASLRGSLAAALVGVPGA